MARTEAALDRLKPGDRVGIVAGSGLLPLDVATALRKAGREPFIIMIAGEDGLEPKLRDFPHEEFPVEKLGQVMPSFRREGVTQVVMAGGVTQRPKLSRIEWSWSLLSLLPMLVQWLSLGDNGVLKLVIGHFERAGMKVVGPHEIVPDLLTPSGTLTKRKPTALDRRDLDAAREAAIAIGRLDVGQAAVSVGGRVIALEGIEGTDGLLERTIALRSHGRLAGRTGGVLVKCTKPGQELRADLPGIGPKTVEDAHAAGLSGIGLQAGRSFILDLEQTRRRADELGLFIVGLDVGETP